MGSRPTGGICPRISLKTTVGEMGTNHQNVQSVPLGCHRLVVVVAVLPTISHDQDMLICVNVFKENLLPLVGSVTVNSKCCFVCSVSVYNNL